MIFVFGSNLAGRHAGGAAREAADNFGAMEGVGVGLTGRAYAIPTMDKDLKTLSLEEIRRYVDDFIAHAKSYPWSEFFVTAIGCGIAGFSPEDIAPMFVDAPLNCTLHRRLVEALQREVV